MAEAVADGLTDIDGRAGDGTEFCADFGEDGIARPALTHIKRVVGITSYGRPWWVATFVMGDPPKRQIMNYFRLLTGGRARRTWLAHYDMNRATDASRQAFLAKVKSQMARLG